MPALHLIMRSAVRSKSRRNLVHSDVGQTLPVRLVDNWRDQPDIDGSETQRSEHDGKLITAPRHASKSSDASVFSFRGPVFIIWSHV